MPSYSWTRQTYFWNEDKIEISRGMVSFQVRTTITADILLAYSLCLAFLRRMEYFKGLLFLTTNRVGQIDDAFISRVHLAIGYNTLSPQDRSSIWGGFFRKLAKEQAGKIQISAAARKWVLEKAKSGQAQLNGRDIRNALQTAITLAEAEAEEDPDFDPDRMTIVVDQSHFERVLEISNKFHNYVQSIRREDERKRAAARNDRNDYWGPSLEGKERISQV